MDGLPPLPDPACVQDKVNLLDKVVKVPFYKRKKGEDASYSRQASFGICLPIDLIAHPEHWREVSAQIALWAWDGGAIIASVSDKSTQRDLLLNKMMMLTSNRLSTKEQRAKKPQSQNKKKRIKK